MPDTAISEKHNPPCNPLLAHLTEKGSFFDLKFWITIIILCIGWAVTAGIFSEKVNYQSETLRKMEDKYKDIPERIARFETDISYIKEGIGGIKSDMEYLKRRKVIAEENH